MSEVPLPTRRAGYAGGNGQIYATFSYLIQRNSPLSPRYRRVEERDLVPHLLENLDRVNALLLNRHAHHPVAPRVAHLGFSLRFQVWGFKFSILGFSFWV